MSNNTTKTLSNKEMRELLAMSKNGSIDARNRLLLANMGLISRIADEVKNPNADRSDLIADGTIRFMELINEYDPDKAALSTYMWKPIRQFMNRNVTDYKPGLPQFIGSYGETIRYLMDKLGRNPEQAEIAECMGISVTVLKNRLNDVSERSRISLDTPVSISDTESVTLKDTEMCSTDHDASTAVMQEDEKRSINLAWNRLTKDDQKILTLRNTADGTKLSLRAAGKVAGVSPETIRLRELEAKNNFRALLDEYGICA